VLGDLPLGNPQVSTEPFHCHCLEPLIYRDLRSPANY